MLNRSGFLAVAAAVVLAPSATATQAVVYQTGQELRGPSIASVRPYAAVAETPVVTTLAFNRILLPQYFAAFHDPNDAHRPLIAMPGIADEPQPHRARHAVIGGLIGGAAGILACTAISNIANDPGSGFSTCDAKAYIGFGLGGAAVGALIGWAI